MTVALDESLMMRVKRKPREDVLTFDECVALNLFWRKGVPVPILAKAFHASKNTIYYRALTGTADSYPNSLYSNQANEVNILVDKVGILPAWKKYVTDDMTATVNEAMASELEKRDADGG